MNEDRIKDWAGDAGSEPTGAAGDNLGGEGHKQETVIDQAKGTVKNAYDQAKDTMGQYTQGAGEYIDRVRDVVDRGVGEGRGYLDRGRRYLDEEFEDFPAMRRAVSDGRDTIAGYVQATPVAALLIAGAIGYGLALLLHARSDPEPSLPRRGRRRR